MKKGSRYLFLFLVFGSFLFGNISGVVFRDLPINGSVYGTYGDNNTSVEPGVQGVTVKAFDISGNEVATTTTDENGNYTLTTSAGNYRIEFSNWPSYLEESVMGAVNNSSVRFVSDGDSVDFGLHNPDDFTQQKIQQWLHQYILMVQQVEILEI